MEKDYIDVPYSLHCCGKNHKLKGWLGEFEENEYVFLQFVCWNNLSLTVTGCIINHCLSISCKPISTYAPCSCYDPLYN